MRPAPSLTDTSVDQLLNSIKITGEGRGRLSLEQGQNVFSYEAVLKEEGDWLMAVSVPLRGEEVMVLRQIKETDFSDENPDSFELRLQNEIDARMKGAELTGEDYIRELRSLVRFVLAPTVDLKRECSPEGQESFKCLLGPDIFMIKVEKDKIFIRKDIKKNHFMELIAENLTESFFSKTDFHLHSHHDTRNSSPIFSLELFWK